VSSKLPRLPFEQLDERAQAVLQERVERLGYLGEFFQVTGVQPTLLVPFMEMTHAFKEVLPQRLIELVALTVARLMDNRYEQHQHERLSHKLGFGKPWISAVLTLAPQDAAELSDAEQQVQQLVIAMVDRRGKAVQQELAAVIAAIGEQQSVAVLFLVGRYITHALIVNSLELAPPVQSIFKEDE
jgi:alkylhydroperoxidase family enzyme